MGRAGLRRFLAGGGLALLVLLSVSGCRQQGAERREASGSEQAWRLLERSEEAWAQVSFRGRRDFVVYEGGREVRRYTQEVTAARGCRRYLTVSPDSEKGTLTVRGSQSQWTYYPQQKRVIVSPCEAPAECLARQRKSLRMSREAGARVVLEEEQTVAGRPCYTIGVYDRHGAVRARYALDKETYFRLRKDDYDEQPQMVSSLVYQSIEYDAPVAENLFTFEVPPGVQVVKAPVQNECRSLAEAERLAGFQAFLPAYMPPGYRLQEAESGVTEVGGCKVLWLEYWDGVNVISLFELPAGACGGAEKYPDAAMWTNRTHCFFLLGVLRPGELEKIRESTLKQPSATRS